MSLIQVPISVLAHVNKDLIPTSDDAQKVENPTSKNAHQDISNDNFAHVNKDLIPTQPTIPGQLLVYISTTSNN